MKIEFPNRVAIIALPLTTLLAAHGYAATPVADYQFQNTYNSAIIPANPLTVVGNPADATFTNNTTVDGQSQTVLTIATQQLTTGTDIGAGVQSQTKNVITNPGNYSAVLLADFDLSSALGATKVFDFKNLSADDGLYINDTTGILEFNEVSNQPANVPLLVTGPTTPVVTGTYTQIVLTRDSSTNLVSVYQDGALDFSFTDTSGLATLGDTPTATTPNADLTVFKDDGTGLGSTLINETSLGDIARLRLYNTPLSAAEVAALDTVAVPEPTTALTLLLTTALLTKRRSQTSGAARVRSGLR